MKSLEILDLGRNQLRTLPKEITKLVSLKVLSVPRNHIRELPLCIADMTSLQVLKFDGNPINFPPQDTLQMPATRGANGNGDGDFRDLSLTTHVKKVLRQYAISGRTDVEPVKDESNDGAATPRLPLKRVASGRFPIKVNNLDTSITTNMNGTFRSPPPVPPRSHQRGLSQHSTAISRPSIMPLTIGSVNERVRSNSETLQPQDRSIGRNRRLGIGNRQPPELGSLDETNAVNHYRGLSHGSAMQGVPPSTDSSPRSATTEAELQRPIYVRRLSVLPERRRNSAVLDPIIETAKGILYAVFQIHPMIQGLLGLTNNGSNKRSSLEIVFYNTKTHVEELEHEIQMHESTILEESAYSLNNEGISRACQTLVSAYGHVCVLLAENADSFVNNGDPRYIRTLLILLYNSIMELRATLSSTMLSQDSIPTITEDNFQTLRPHQRETLHKASSSSTTSLNYPGLPSTPELRNGKNSKALGQLNTRPGYGEDMQLERIRSSTKLSTDLMMQILPRFSTQLKDAMESAMQRRDSTQFRLLKGLIAACETLIEQTRAVQAKCLANPQAMVAKAQTDFVGLCVGFIAAWEQLVSKLATVGSSIPLPADTKARLKPMHKSMKDTTASISHSRWSQLVTQGTNKDALLLSPTPITPQNASLGPAMQATISSASSNGSFAHAFQGNVFDRAGALLANPGISLSRSGNVSRQHSTSNSASSFTSTNSDNPATPTQI